MMPRLYVTAAHKSSGKTIVTLGLARTLRQHGDTVACFKKGPDFIDPMWLQQASGHDCFNLDFNTQSPAQIQTLLMQASADADITLIDRQNYHLFQPLLYQVATAGLAPSDIAWPIRGVLKSQRNVTVLLDEVADVDTDTKQVITQTRTVPYDYLILATGARHDTVARGWIHRREDQCTRAAVEDHLDASCITVKVEGVMESATKPA